MESCVEDKMNHQNMGGGVVVKISMTIVVFATFFSPES